MFGQLPALSRPDLDRDPDLDLAPAHFGHAASMESLLPQTNSVSLLDRKRLVVNFPPIC